MGLLLLVLMAYVGEMRRITIVYAVTAVICFVAGIVVSATRSQARKNPSDAEVTD